MRNRGIVDGRFPVVPLLHPREVSQALAEGIDRQVGVSVQGGRAWARRASASCWTKRTCSSVESPRIRSRCSSAGCVGFSRTRSFAIFLARFAGFGTYVARVSFLPRLCDRMARVHSRGRRATQLIPSSSNRHQGRIACRLLSVLSVRYALSDLFQTMLLSQIPSITHVVCRHPSSSPCRGRAYS